MSKQEPSVLLSVVMPAHRVDEYLAAAIVSVEVAIKGINAEFIIVANGKNRFDVEAFVKEKAGLNTTRVVTSEFMGIIYALNKGVETACGKYVGRFDSDDICIEGRFEKQLEMAEKDNLDFVFANANIIDEAGNKSGKVLESTVALNFVCRLVHPTALIRRDCLLQLGGYGNLEYSEDYHLWIRAQCEGYRIATLGESVIDYRVHSGQATTKLRLSRTYATNTGIKITLGLRYGSWSLVLGAALDLMYWVYRKVVDKLIFRRFE